MHPYGGSGEQLAGDAERCRIPYTGGEATFRGREPLAQYGMEQVYSQHREVRELERDIAHDSGTEAELQGKRREKDVQRNPFPSRTELPQLVERNVDECAYHGW